MKTELEEEAPAGAVEDPFGEQLARRARGSAPGSAQADRRDRRAAVPPWFTGSGVKDLGRIAAGR